MNRTLRASALVFFAVIAAIGAGPPAACAQEESAETAAPDEAATAEARERFNRALELYEEGLLDQALVEFQRAYEIAPAPPVLYNLGEVYAALGRAVDAVDTFERYLREMGDALSDERRAEVEAELRRQQSRIAFVQVQTEAPEATIWIDGTERGPVTAEPVRVTAGTVLVEVHAPGHQPFQTTLRLAGGLTETVEAHLEPVQVAMGRIQVASRTRGATVLLDGEEVGTTPLPDTLEVVPGHHVVEATRRGYQPVRAEVDVEAAEQEEVDLSLSVQRYVADGSGHLVLRLPMPPTRLVVDGEELEPAAEIVLPHGRHEIEIDVPQRRRYRGHVDITAAETREVTPRLVWTDLEARIAANRTQVQAGWITAGVGLPLLLGAVGVLGVYVVGRQQLWECSVPGATVECGDLANNAALNSGVTVAGVVGLPLASVGLVLSVIGLGLLMGSSSDAGVAEAASFRVGLGPGSITVRGTL